MTSMGGAAAVENMPMNGRLQNRTAFSLVAFALFVLVFALNAAAQAASHFLGTVTAISGTTLTIKTAQGDEHQVLIPASAELKRIEPGQTSLSAAVAMQFSELATGDRVLVWIDPNSPAGTTQALRLVAIKAADLAKKQEQETEEWQHGVGGLVKSIDPSTGSIVISFGAGPAIHIVTIHTTKATVFKRYAPASVSYAQAQLAPITDIHPGDQLMARGDKNAADTEMTADEVVSGSFRNISGIIASVTPANSTFTLKDLATKKMVTVKVPEDAQMRRLPERMAQALAARLKGAAPPGRGSGAPRQHSESAQHRGGEAPHMDAQQMLSRAPAIHFPDLQKGDAVMLVATPGDSEATAITLIAGVEPLLEAPASQDLLANWSMGSGGESSGSDQQQ